MRKLVLVVGLAVGLTLSANAAASGTGIKGVVLNTTCPGPCSYPPPPPPRYTGGGLTVNVRRLPGHQLIARLHPDDGRFRLHASPGRYRVRAVVGDPSRASCWEGETKRVKVIAGAFAHVRLHVQNTCVV